MVAWQRKHGTDNSTQLPIVIENYINAVGVAVASFPLLVDCSDASLGTVVVDIALADRVVNDERGSSMALFG